MNTLPCNLFLLLKLLIEYIKTKGRKRLIFLLYYLREDYSNFDDGILVTEIGYFGHHLEKALKHPCRGSRGSEKRNRLEKLLSEYERRESRNNSLIEWARHLINYYDNNKKFYLNRIEKFAIRERNETMIGYITKRTTTRFWQPKEVESAILDEIIDISLSAPISCNRQSIKFLVKKNVEQHMELGNSSNTSMIQKAPVVIYVAVDTRFYNEKYAPALDAGSVCSTLLLCAQAFGLYGCWIYAADSREVQNLFQKATEFSKYCIVFSALALGYPMDSPRKPPRVKNVGFMPSV